MKKSPVSFLAACLFIFPGFILTLSGQEAPKTSPSLPEDINKIVTASCMPCHSSQGGLMSRTKLNFTEWNQYSLSKQKDKADEMYTILKKEKMPPKSARENNPDIIPTKEQIDAIKKWADSLKADDK
jgi:hypothetical protein